MEINLLKKINSKNGNEIQLLEAESHFSETKGKIILFIGIFHGDEPEGEGLINNLIREIKINPTTIANNKILFIPVLNPDGKELNTRVNANGVDLNRNFPTENWELSEIESEFYSGKHPASEIETKFLIEILDKYKPQIIISIHKPYKVVNFDGPAQLLAEKISKITGYPIQSDIGYPTPGSFGTYTGVERNIQTITLELPDNTSIDELWNTNKKAFIEIISE